MRRARSLDLGVLVCAGGFYLVNRLVLIPHAPGALGWFLTCYANDLFAGAAMAAWLSLLLCLGRLKLHLDWRVVAPYLLLCGLVWEFLAPAWKAGAVCDLWDLAAYQLGGAGYLLLARGRA